MGILWVLLVLFGLFLAFKERNGEKWEPEGISGRVVMWIASIAFILLIIGLLIEYPEILYLISNGQR